MNPDESKSLVPVPVPANITDPKMRRQLREQLRAEEWAMHQKVMAAARTALDNFLSNPHKITAQDVARLTELGLELGRSACGLAPGQSDEAPYRGPTISLEFRAAIEKVYGQPVPAEFIDADEVVPITDAQTRDDSHNQPVSP